MSKKPDLSKVPTPLRPHIEAKMSMFTSVIDAFEAVLHETEQPLSANEIRIRAEKKLGRKLYTLTVQNVLSNLIEFKRVSGRIETAEERMIRSGGRAPRGPQAMLYFRGKSVPRRTEVLSDIVLGDGQATPPEKREYARKAYQKKRVAKAKAKARKKQKASTAEHSSVVSSVSAIVTERDALLKRVAQLEDTLARINSIFVKK
jgi:hypothetical protein